jgi:WD40 repeat protein
MKTYFHLFRVLAIVCFGLIFAPRAQAVTTELLTCNLNDSSVEIFDGITGVYLKTLVAPTSGGLDSPQNLAIGPDGNLYVTSWGTNSVKRYDMNSGAYIDDFVPSGSGGLQAPDQLYFRPDDKLYVSNRFKGMIKRYDSLSGAYIDTFVSSSSRLYGFTGFTFGPDGNIYAGEFNGSHDILQFDGSTGQFLRLFNHRNPVIDAAVTGLTFGPDGNLYACRWIADLVERYHRTSGIFMKDIVTAGSGGLTTADYLSFGPDGDLYVAGQGNGAILRYNGHTSAFKEVFTKGGPPLFPKGVLFISQDF